MSRARTPKASEYDEIVLIGRLNLSDNNEGGQLRTLALGVVVENSPDCFSADRDPGALSNHLDTDVGPVHHRHRIAKLLFQFLNHLFRLLGRQHRVFGVGIHRIGIKTVDLGYPVAGDDPKDSANSKELADRTQNYRQQNTGIAGPLHRHLHFFRPGVANVVGVFFDPFYKQSRQPSRPDRGKVANVLLANRNDFFGNCDPVAGLKLRKCEFFSREATSSPKEILWVFTGIRAYLIPSTSSIFSFFIAEMVPRERGRTPKAD